MNQVKKSNRIILIIIIATVFGLMGGIGGEIVSKTYISDYIYTPYLSEITLSSGNGSGLIIRDAKKIVIEQNEKAVETVRSGRDSIAAIFKKNNQSLNSAKFNFSDYYQKSEELSQGFILTSDGWIITDFTFPNKGGQINVSDYVVLTRDGKIWMIDKIVKDKLSNYYFIHIPAADLPVKEFASASDLASGQLLEAVNWDGQSWLSPLSSLEEKSEDAVFSSDTPAGELALVNKPSADFNSSILFSLDNKIAGFIDSQGNAAPISKFYSAISSLLENKTVKRPYLGVKYINLSSLASAAFNSGEQYKKGALIYKNGQGIAVVKGSPAEKAGLKEGDIITSINNIETNQENSLSGIMQQFTAGDKVKIVFTRGGEQKEVEVVLGELK